MACLDCGRRAAVVKRVSVAKIRGRRGLFRPPLRPFSAMATSWRRAAAPRIGPCPGRRSSQRHILAHGSASPGPRARRAAGVDGALPFTFGSPHPTVSVLLGRVSRSAASCRPREEGPARSRRGGGPIVRRSTTPSPADADHSESLIPGLAAMETMPGPTTGDCAPHRPPRWPVSARLDFRDARPSSPRTSPFQWEFALSTRPAASSNAPPPGPTEWSDRRVPPDLTSHAIGCVDDDRSFG